MYEEMAVLSPLVATREFCELRYCQMIEQGSWIVVNVSYHLPQFVSQSSHSYKFPSGCLIQDMPNGYSKVLSFFLLSTNFSFMIVSLSLLMVFVNRLLGLNMLKLKKKNRLMSFTEK